LGGRPERIAFEGQAAMQVEFAARRLPVHRAYPLDFELLSSGAAPASPQGLAPFVEAVLLDRARGADLSEIGGKFQQALVDAAVRVAAHADAPCIALSGGCFQNQWLLSGLTRALEAAGHRVYVPRQIPPNDGGIAAGQAAIAAHIEFDGARDLV
jgi:hydrogenase maturation protein HypF